MELGRIKIHDVSQKRQVTKMAGRLGNFISNVRRDKNRMQVAEEASNYFFLHCLADFFVGIPEI